MKETQINIIGGGLAGSEAAWQIAKRGIKVKLFDMKPQKFSPAHKNQNFAELVCSNSFRSDDKDYNAVGLLHEEMRRFGSLIMECADICKVPAGGALAVDREKFAALVTKRLAEHPNISIVAEEITALPNASFSTTIIATGPLTSEALIADILEKTNKESLSFYDAIAPLVYTESINFDKAWYQSRYDKGNAADYINCALNQEEYEVFYRELSQAQTKQFHEFEKETYFEGCLPIEIMAQRGHDTLRYGPMKPVGLTNPNSTEKPYAVVQLRQDNEQDTLRNIVGFQTKMTYSEQKRIFKLIPGLENAQFARLGGIHKNTFIKSPILLDKYLRLKTMPHIRFAGQITGCEGYVESAAIGMLCGYFTAAQALGQEVQYPPRATALGSMLNHLTDSTNVEQYAPMNISFGLFPKLEEQKRCKGRDRKAEYSKIALQNLEKWLSNF